MTNIMNSKPEETKTLSVSSAQKRIKGASSLYLEISVNSAVGNKLTQYLLCVSTDQLGSDVSWEKKTLQDIMINLISLG